MKEECGDDARYKSGNTLKFTLDLEFDWTVKNDIPYYGVGTRLAECEERIDTGHEGVAMHWSTIQSIFPIWCGKL